MRMTVDISQNIPKDAAKESAEQPCEKRNREIDALLQICRDWWRYLRRSDALIRK